MYICLYLNFQAVIYNIVYRYNKTPFPMDGRQYSFHNVGQKISQVVDRAAKVVGTAKKACDVGMTIYKIGCVMAPFMI